MSSVSRPLLIHGTVGLNHGSLPAARCCKNLEAHSLTIQTVIPQQLSVQSTTNNLGKLHKIKDI